MIVERVYKSIKPSPPEVSDRYRASSAGDCRRQIAYAMKGTTRDPLSPRRLLLLQDGKLHHSDIRYRIKQCKDIKLTKAEDEYTKKYEKDGIKIVVVGHPDGLLNNKVILEFKGVNSRAFTSARKTGETKKDYEDQSQLYMWLMDKDRALIVLKNKDTSELLEIPIRRDDDRIEKVLQRFIDTEKFRRQKKLHPRDFTEGSKECNFCDFFKTCWGKDAEKKTTSMFTAGPDRIIDIDKKDRRNYKELMEIVETHQDVVSQLVLKAKEMKGDAIRVGDKYQVEIWGKRRPHIIVRDLENEHSRYSGRSDESES